MSVCRSATGLTSAVPSWGFGGGPASAPGGCALITCHQVYPRGVPPRHDVRRGGPGSAEPVRQECGHGVGRGRGVSRCPPGSCLVAGSVGGPGADARPGCLRRRRSPSQGRACRRRPAARRLLPRRVARGRQGPRGRWPRWSPRGRVAVARRWHGRRRVRRVRCRVRPPSRGGGSGTLRPHGCRSPGRSRARWARGPRWSARPSGGRLRPRGPGSRWCPGRCSSGVLLLGLGDEVSGDDLHSSAV